MPHQKKMTYNKFQKPNSNSFLKDRIILITTRMKNRNLLLILFICIFQTLSAQDVVEIRNGNLRAIMSSTGFVPDPDGIFWLSYEEEDGSTIPLAHATSPWFSGIDPAGNLFLNASTYGPIAASTIMDKVFQVSGEDIQAHIADFEDNGVIDNPIASVYSWPGRGNPFFSEYNEGLELPATLYGLAPFWDTNGDGFYDPMQGDYPVINVRGCEEVAVIPGQLYWCVYNLFGPSNNDPMFEIQLSAFTFACEEEHPLNNALLANYKTIYIANEALDSSYWGLFTDFDLGCPFDDYVGSFPERNLAYFYNSDNMDENCSGLTGFGTNPPAVGVDIFRGPLALVDDQIQEVPLSSIIAYYNAGVSSTPPGTTDPATVVEYYNYLQGLWRDGLPLTSGGIGYQGMEATSFAFPGLPEQENGWTEWEAQNPPSDRRVLMNFGPFDLPPGAVNEFALGYSYYRGEGDHLDQPEGLRDQSDQLQAYFDNCFIIDAPNLPPCTQIVSNTKEATSVSSQLKIYPNPSNDIINIDSPYQVEIVHIRDIQGKYLKSFSGNTGDVSDLAAGLYLLEIEVAGRKYHKKLIVN